MSKIDEVKERLSTLNHFAESMGQSKEVSDAWCQGFISACADYDIITEDEFDELLKLYCERIQ